MSFHQPSDVRTLLPLGRSRSSTTGWHDLDTRHCCVVAPRQRRLAAKMNVRQQKVDSPGRTACRLFEHERRLHPLVWSAHCSPRPNPRCPSQQRVTRPLASASRAAMLPRGIRCCRHGPGTTNAKAGNIVMPSPVTRACAHA